IGIVVGCVVAVAVRIPIIVRIESRVIDEPEAVDELATMPMPPMIMAPVPIAMPIGWASRKDMLPSDVGAAVFEAIPGIISVSCAGAGRAMAKPAPPPPP